MTYARSRRAARQRGGGGASPQTHIEIEEGIHLVLNNGDRLEQLLCIHGPHHAVHTAWTQGESEGGQRGQREMERHNQRTRYYNPINSY